MGAKRGQSKNAEGRDAARQRLALILFGALFVLLFAGFAIAQGIGEPGVPSGDVAKVDSVPDEISTISEADFKRALVQQALQGGLKKPPKPGDKKYEEIKTATMSALLDEIWLQGEGEELGIEITPKQITTELEQIKKQSFKTPAAYKEFLQTSRLSKKDILARVKLQLLGTQIQEVITKSALPASSSEVSEYYEAAKATQYTTGASRDIRVIASKDDAKAEQAKALLEKDNSPASWKKVAEKFSIDPSTKSKGGLQAGVTEKVLQEPLKAAVFQSNQGEVVGPVVFQGNTYVVEVVKLNPEKVQALGEVKSQITTQLTQQRQQEAFTEFIAEYESKWRSRTHCASDFLIERCANYVGTGHPASAPPSCYEADPKSKGPIECPAPVTSVSPALPGTITVLKPQGEPLPQRARPEGLKEAAEGATGLPEGVPPGATEAPPPSGE